MKNNLQLLELEIETLRLEKENLQQRKELYEEIYALQTDIIDAGGNDLVNFQNDVKFVLLTTWDCIVFICGGLLNALDNHLDYLNGLPCEDRGSGGKT